MTTLRKRGLLPDRLVPHVGLLKALQGVHDDDDVMGLEVAEFRESIHRAMTEVASEFGLSTAVLEEVVS